MDKLIKKQEILETNRDTVLLAINTCIEKFDAQINIFNNTEKINKEKIDEINDLKLTYIELEKKIKSKEELTAREYSLIGIALITVAQYLNKTIERELEMVKSVKTLSEGFLA